MSDATHLTFPRLEYLASHISCVVDVSVVPNALRFELKPVSIELLNRPATDISPSGVEHTPCP